MSEDPDPFALFTLEELRVYAHGAWAVNRARSGRLKLLDSKLPLALAECGPLMEHAVRLSGRDGLSRTDLLSIFAAMGEERRDRGLKWMREAGNVSERTEPRANKLGRLQRQVIFTAS